MSRIIDELQRRNVIRVGIAYLAVAWLVLQVAETLLPVYGFTDVAIRNLVVLLAIGLVLALILSWSLEWSPQGIVKESESDESAPAEKPGFRRLDQFIIFVLSIALALFMLDKFVLDPERDAREVQAATEKGRVDALVESYGEKSIAVLAFADMSPDGDQEYFSDGIAEELLNLLATIRDLRVISRSTAFTFKDSTASLPDIAEQLGVTYILEGSVRKSGDKIRVTAQLIEARTDTHLWSDTYDRTLDDVFAIQDEISAQIVDQLKLTLLDGNLSAQKIDPVAYEKYLKALFIVNTSNRSRLREAQSLLNEVLSIAPDYIPALDALGRLYYRIPKTEGLSIEENLAEVHALADQVVEIDPNSASALIWQGWFAFVDDELQEAAVFYERAIRVDPNNIHLLRVLVSFLTRIDRPDDAVALGHYLLLRDPACAVCILNLSHAYRGAGKYEEAAQSLESSLAWHEPNARYYGMVGEGWLMAGKPEQALAAFENESGGNWHEMGAIMALHDLGRSQEFDSRFSEVLRNAQDPEIIARIYAWVGDSDKAFEWVDKMPEADQQRFIESSDADFYAKIKPDDRWLAMQEKYRRTGDASSEIINFTYTLPAGAASQ